MIGPLCLRDDCTGRGLAVERFRDPGDRMPMAWYVCAECGARWPLALLHLPQLERDLIAQGYATLKGEW